MHYASGFTREGIENDPGSFAIKNTVQTSHYQGHPRYGDSAGMQFTRNAYRTFKESLRMRKDIYKCKWFDLILERRDKMLEH